MKPPSKSTLVLALALLGVVAEGIYYFQFRHRPRAAEVAAEAPPLQDIQLPGAKFESGIQLRPDLREALGMDKEVPGGRRIDLLRSLGGDLSPDECDALLRALLEARLASTPAGWFSEYFHEIASALQEQKSATGNFIRVLATVARDPRRDAVVRDYSIQHLRQAWDHAIPDLRGPIESTFREFAGSNDPVLAGPGLLSLHLLGQPVTEGGIARQGSPARIATVTGPARPRIENSAIDPLVGRALASAPTSGGVTARLTAIRIAGDRLLDSRRPDLRRIASDDKNEHAVVRMAAISAMARFGDGSDKPFLESLDRTDPRIAGAVQYALASLH